MQRINKQALLGAMIVTGIVFVAGITFALASMLIVIYSLDEIIHEAMFFRIVVIPHAIVSMLIGCGYYVKEASDE